MVKPSDGSFRDDRSDAFFMPVLLFIAQAAIQTTLNWMPAFAGIKAHGVGSTASPRKALRSVSTGALRDRLGLDFRSGQRVLQERRNEKAVKSLKTNGPAKSLIRRI
jgi:hypothetical protein